MEDDIVVYGLFAIIVLPFVALVITLLIIMVLLGVCPRVREETLDVILIAGPIVIGLACVCLG